MKALNIIIKYLACSFAFVSLIILASPSIAGGPTEDLFRRHKGNVLQVRILDIASNAKAGIGSGFAVTSHGHIITNYHVISELVVHPGRYRAEYLLENGQKGTLQLIDLDVIHDLALLKAEGVAGKFLKLEGKEPVKGEKLFSLGNPFDLGLIIVEGTFNGFLEKSLYKKIHFTGSINPGMSGGPTLNQKGAVVGINVATAGNQVSFLVPAMYAIELLARGKNVNEPPEDFSKIVSRQLLDNQDSYMGPLMQEPFSPVSIGSYEMPGELSPFIKCWGDTRKSEGLLYEQVYQTCSTDDDIYLSGNMSSGSIHFRHELFRTEKLGIFRFYNFLESHFKQPHMHLGGDEESVGNFQCESNFVEHNGLNSKLVFCMRAYKKLAGLYDSFMTATTFSRDNEALHTTLVLSGVSYENAVRFSRAYMEAIVWKK